jgi:hypothetical protein
MLGRKQADDDRAGRILLDEHETQTAARLSKLTGQRRDQVLREAYRRADQILAEPRK